MTRYVFFIFIFILFYFFLFLSSPLFSTYDVYPYQYQNERYLRYHFSYTIPHHDTDHYRHTVPRDTRISLFPPLVSK
ncbi:hypothetical protein B0H16DRAFT_1639625 [Mycena metata]|uniref:Uncharacterized protein n=1 Tax=Mycena metata TaxID=1033252 RepID=A0AAD7DZF0_9AGAR|nr:hypothetical protein B0H16DRAFT_1639625 [Mycena metata]